MINKLNDDILIDMAELFKVFGDFTRIKIISALIEGEMCVLDIASKTNTSQSAVSHQLRILKNSKLIKYKKKGRQIYYSIADSHVEEIFKKGWEHTIE